MDIKLGMFIVYSVSSFISAVAFVSRHVYLIEIFLR